MDMLLHTRCPQIEPRRRKGTVQGCAAAHLPVAHTPALSGRVPVRVPGALLLPTTTVVYPGAARAQSNRVYYTCIHQHLLDDLHQPHTIA